MSRSRHRRPPKRHFRLRHDGYVIDVRASSEASARLRASATVNITNGARVEPHDWALIDPKGRPPGRP